MAVKWAAPPGDCVAHPEPLHLRIVLSEPTAQMLLASAPQMPRRSKGVGEVCPDQTVPFQYRITPFLPTAQTLFGFSAQTPCSASVVFEVCELQMVPFH